MPRVRIPSSIQDLTDGKATVTVHGTTVRQVINSLDQLFPGVKNRLMDGGQIRPEISLFIDGEITASGLLETVGESSEVLFLPRIAGG